MSDELVSIKTGPLAAVPDHLKGVQGRDGLENVDKTDLVLPRLAVCQSNTPQRKKGNALFIEGLEEGQFFNTVTNEVYGDTIQLVPILFAKSRIYFRDLKEGGGILCRSFNGIDGGTVSPTCEACPNSKFGKDEPPLCTNFMNFPSVIVGREELIAASWKSTALKPARTWLTRVQGLNKPLFATVCEVKLAPTKNDSGEFFVPTFSFKRWTTAEEFTLAQKIYNDLRGKTIVVEHEEEQEQDTPF